MSLLPLFIAPNLVAPDVVEGNPWDHVPDARLVGRFKSTPKALRATEILNIPATRWCVYQTSVGQARGAMVTKDDGSNPVAALRGFVADFDRVIAFEDAEAAIRSQLTPELWPQFIETGFTGHCRLLWILDKELVVASADMGDRLIERAHAHLHLDQLLVGYDKSSGRSYQRWTLGEGIAPFNPNPMPSAWLEGIRFELLKLDAANSKESVDIKVLEHRAHELFPNRWQGPFEYEHLGVRFWDKTADNMRGAMLLPQGVFTLTGPKKGLIQWGEILGHEWFKAQQLSQIGVITADMYSDAKGYWTKDAGGNWITEPAERIACRLRVRGLSGVKKKGQAASEIDNALDFLNQERRINFSAPLLYKPEGIVTINGSRVLNTSSVKALRPGAPGATPKDFPWLWDFLHGFLDQPAGGLDAVDNLLAWIQRAYVGAYKLRATKGQCLFFCGPRETGKTLLTDRILAPLLGGESANPMEYFVGKNRFTGHILISGLLAINDSEAPEGREREYFLQQLKSWVANNNFKHEQKGRDAYTVDWSGRLVITLNDTPRDLRILPELNSNTADKLQFYATKPYAKAWLDKYELEPTIERELPLFARWLLDTYQPKPDTLVGGRMGVAPFHHPDLVDKALQNQPEWQLYTLLERWVELVHGAERTDPDDWVGQPMDLYNELHAFAQNGLAGVRTFGVNQLGAALGSLVRQDREAIQAERGKGYRIIKRLLKSK